MKENKGITLIALIITIIVMVVLVAVTVSIVVRSGIIGKAKQAKDDTQTAYQYEQTLGESINIGGNVYNSIDDIVGKTEDTGFTITLEFNGEPIHTFTCHAYQNETWGEWITRKYESGELNEIINYDENSDVRDTLTELFTQTQYDGGRIYIGDSTDGDTMIIKRITGSSYHNMLYDDVIEANTEYELIMQYYWLN